MNDTFDSTEYIGQVLGPEISLPLSWMFLLTSVYVVIFLMGTIGNILVVIVILKFRFMRENITNLYLCNLAVTDLLSITAGQFFLLFFQQPKPPLLPQSSLSSYCADVSPAACSVDDFLTEMESSILVPVPLKERGRDTKCGNGKSSEKERKMQGGREKDKEIK